MSTKDKNAKIVSVVSETPTRRDMLKFAVGPATVIAASALLPTAAAQAARLTKGQPCMELPPPNAESFNITCQYCNVNCGYKVHVWRQGAGIKPKGAYASPLSGDWYSSSFIVPAEKEGKPVFIAVIPDKDCVINKGDFSVRGGTNALTLFSKNLPSYHHRLTQPMIRKHGKGSPLEVVSWEDALSFTAEKLSALKDKYGPDSLALCYGDWLYQLPTYVVRKFWNEGLGSAMFAGNGWVIDNESGGVESVTGGGKHSFTEDDFDVTKLLVTVGKNLNTTSSVWYYRFFANMAQGDAKHIDIDPRRTHQAQLAEKHGGLHLQVKPGTDPILLGAMVREVLNRGAYDKTFVDQYVVGLDTVREVVQNSRFAIENAAKETWVPADKIRRAVDLLIERRGHTMLLLEKGVMHQMSSYDSQVAMMVLGSMLGNLGKPGACTDRAGGHPDGSIYTPDLPSGRKQLNYWEGLEKGDVKATWALGTNVFRQFPGQNKLRSRIGDGFFIVQDRIHTEMEQSADVVFPAATWGEADLLQSSDTRRLRVNQKFMDPPGNAKPDWWIVAQVAKRMGLKGYDWNSPIEIWDEIRSRKADLRDLTWDALLKAGTSGLLWPSKNGQAPSRMFSEEWEKVTGKRFPTKDGKVHFESFAHLKKFDPSTSEWAEVDAQHPLMLIDFRLDELWNTGYTYWDKPMVNARQPDEVVWIHPKEAKARGLADGDPIKVESKYGSCTAVAHVTDGVMPGIVAASGGGIFPKKEQLVNYVMPSRMVPITGDVDTMVAINIRKA